MTDRLPKAREVPDTKSPKEVGLSPNVFPSGVRHSAHSKKADCSLDSESRSLWSQEGVKTPGRIGSSYLLHHLPNDLFWEVAPGVT